MKLYRYIALSRLLTCVRLNKNILRHPTCWPDPFESAIFRAGYEREAGLFFNDVEDRWQSWPPDGPGPFKTLPWRSTPADSISRHFYCQCWTRKPESDAMWRVYSHGSDDLAVRITVDRENLLKQTKRALGETNKVILEDVDYVAEEQVIEKFRAFSQRYAVAVLKRQGMHMWFDDVCNLMRWKRQPFDYELETRLMVVAWEQLDAKGWNAEEVPRELAYSFTVNDLVEEVMLHPLYSPEQRDSVIDQARSAGYCGPIRQSDLYLPRNFDHVVGKPR